MQDDATEAPRAAIAALQSHRATELTDAADRACLIQPIPDFRAIVAAWSAAAATRSA